MNKVFCDSALTRIPAILLFLILLPTAARAADVVIVIDPADSETCIRHGADVLSLDLKEKGLDVVVSESASEGDQFTVYIGKPGSSWVSVIEGEVDAMPSVHDRPEAYVTFVSRHTDKKFAVAMGSDEVGAMYAAYEFADQVRRVPKGADVISYLSPLRREPFLAIRAVNTFLHVEALDDPNSWYFDESFWTGYLDLLSRSRYNLLDFHAMYGVVSTWFPNVYLYMLKSDKYPDVGIPADRAAMNLAMFNRIIRMAKERGIKVSLMSYHASWRVRAGEEDKPHEPSEYELVDYTKEMVAKIIKECPDLWMIGFRIGESGMGEDFYAKSYLAGIEEGGRDINMFTHSWGATPYQINHIASLYPGKTFVEIKYNGEQFGLPYQAITNSLNTNAGYSWESYTNRPRDYKIIWQIRANGTHRLIRWGDPDFASRAIRAATFQGSSGFTMEPFTAYYPPTDFIFKKDGKITYRWDHNRNWFWYVLWGRTGYDPDIKESVWIDMFKYRYGAKAGPAAFEAMVAGSKLIPLIYSYRCMGYDHRDYAPEYEYGGTIEDFIRRPEHSPSVLLDKTKYQEPLDPNVMAPIYDYVDESLSVKKGRYVDARMSPLQVADELDFYADETEKLMIDALRIESKDKTDMLAMGAEFLVAVHLARYYAEKIRSATSFSYYRETNSWYDLLDAEKKIKSAHAHWAKLAAHGEKYFRPIVYTLRMKTTGFTWRKESEKLAGDTDIIKAEKKKYLEAVSRAKGYSISLHPEIRPAAGKVVKMKANVFGLRGGEKLVYHFKYENAAGKTKTFSRISGTKTGFKITIPAEWNKPGKAVFYLELVKGNKALARYPESGAVKMLIRGENNKPEIFVDAVRLADKSTYRIFANVTDDTGVESVRLRYTPMPSQTEWHEKRMKHIGGSTYTADLPVSPEGWIYYIEAADVFENAAQYPDFRKQTPYIPIDSFDPDRGPDVVPVGM